MVVDFCSKSCNWMMSLAHDLNQSNAIPIDPHCPQPNPSSNFYFLNFGTSDHESSLVDVLFYDGNILLLQLKSPVIILISLTIEHPLPPTPLSPPPLAVLQDEKESLGEIMAEKPIGLRL